MEPALCQSAHIRYLLSADKRLQEVSYLHHDPKHAKQRRSGWFNVSKTYMHRLSWGRYETEIVSWQEK